MSAAHICLALVVGDRECAIFHTHGVAIVQDTEVVAFHAELERLRDSNALLVCASALQRFIEIHDCIYAPATALSQGSSRCLPLNVANTKLDPASGPCMHTGLHCAVLATNGALLTPAPALLHSQQ